MKDEPTRYFFYGGKGVCLKDYYRIIVFEPESLGVSYFYRQGKNGFSNWKIESVENTDGFKEISEKRAKILLNKSFPDLLKEKK